MYARLITAWAQADPIYAADVVEGMATQRAELGLGPGEFPALRTPIEVVPVIAIGLPLTTREDVPLRFAAVREALASAREPLAGLQLWTLTASGEITQSAAVDLASLAH